MTFLFTQLFGRLLKGGHFTAILVHFVLTTKNPALEDVIFKKSYAAYIGAGLFFGAILVRHFKIATPCVFLGGDKSQTPLYLSQTADE